MRRIVISLIILFQVSSFQFMLKYRAYQEEYMITNVMWKLIPWMEYSNDLIILYLDLSTLCYWLHLDNITF